jgi:hypothetical protein
MPGFLNEILAYSNGAWNRRGQRRPVDEAVCCIERDVDLESIAAASSIGMAANPPQQPPPAPASVARLRRPGGAGFLVKPQGAGRTPHRHRAGSRFGASPLGCGEEDCGRWAPGPRWWVCVPRGPGATNAGSSKFYARALGRADRTRVTSPFPFPLSSRAQRACSSRDMGGLLAGALRSTYGRACRE